MDNSYSNSLENIIFISAINNFILSFVNNFILSNIFNMIDYLFTTLFGIILVYKINDDDQCRTLCKIYKVDELKRDGFINEFIKISGTRYFYLINISYNSFTPCKRREFPDVNIYFTTKNKIKLLKFYCNSYVDEYITITKKHKSDTILLHLEANDFSTSKILNHFSEYRQYQQSIVDAIIKTYNENKCYCMAYIHGEPGVGKSEIAHILTNQIDGKLVLGAELFGKYFHYEINKHFEDRKIIVFLIDEIDVVIKKINEAHNKHMKKIKNKSLLESIEDAKSEDEYQDYDKENVFYGDGKKKWNFLLDTIPKFYKNCIFLLTSNKSVSEIDNEYDNSYLRAGRVTMHVENVGKEEQKIFVLQKEKNTNYFAELNEVTESFS